MTDKKEIVLLSDLKRWSATIDLAVARYNCGQDLKLLSEAWRINYFATRMPQGFAR